MEHGTIDAHWSRSAIAESSLFLDFPIENDVTYSLECRSYTCTIVVIGSQMAGGFGKQWEEAAVREEGRGWRGEGDDRVARGANCTCITGTANKSPMGTITSTRQWSHMDISITFVLVSWSFVYFSMLFIIFASVACRVAGSVRIGKGFFFFFRYRAHAARTSYITQIATF